MLSLLSAKFAQRPIRNPHEPRAAMFLNRFTRTLAIMYATDALANVLGLRPDQVRGKSFYECIQENCLADAVRCLESAKANDSIAYLRFWFRDPRPVPSRDDIMADAASASNDMDDDDNDDDGGVYLDGHLNDDDHFDDGPHTQAHRLPSPPPPVHPTFHRHSGISAISSSRSTTNLRVDSVQAIYGEVISPDSSHSSAPTITTTTTTTFDGHGSRRSGRGRRRRPRPSRHLSTTPSLAEDEDDDDDDDDDDERDGPIEVEAVVSCTSDGLVVVLRRARPLESIAPLTSPPPVYTNGLFASPWAATPVMPPPPPPPPPPPLRPEPRMASIPFGAATGLTPRPGHVVIEDGFHSGNGVNNGPPLADFMNSIREVAVFAWSLTGINGSLARFGRGTPRGESQPPDGLPIWDPTYQPGSVVAPAEHRPWPDSYAGGLPSSSSSSPSVPVSNGVDRGSYGDGPHGNGHDGNGDRGDDGNGHGGVAPDSRVGFNVMGPTDPMQGVMIPTSNHAGHDFNGPNLVDGVNRRHHHYYHHHHLHRSTETGNPPQSPPDLIIPGFRHGGSNHLTSEGILDGVGSHHNTHHPPWTTDPGFDRPSSTYARSGLEPESGGPPPQWF